MTLPSNWWYPSRQSLGSFGSFPHSQLSTSHSFWLPFTKKRLNQRECCWFSGKGPGGMNRKHKGMAPRSLPGNQQGIDSPNSIIVFLFLQLGYRKNFLLRNRHHCVPGVIAEFLDIDGKASGNPRPAKRQTCAVVVLCGNGCMGFTRF